MLLRVVTSRGFLLGHVVRLEVAVPARRVFDALCPLLVVTASQYVAFNQIFYDNSFIAYHEWKSVETIVVINCFRLTLLHF